MNTAHLRKQRRRRLASATRLGSVTSLESAEHGCTRVEEGTFASGHELILAKSVPASTDNATYGTTMTNTTITSQTPYLVPPEGTGSSTHQPRVSHSSSETTSS